MKLSESSTKVLLCFLKSPEVQKLYLGLNEWPLHKHLSTFGFWENVPQFFRSPGLLIYEMWPLDKKASIAPLSINILWPHGTIRYSKLFSEKQAKIHSLAVLFFSEKFTHHWLTAVNWILPSPTDVHVLISRLEEIFMLYCEYIIFWGKRDFANGFSSGSPSGEITPSCPSGLSQSQVSWKTEGRGSEKKGLQYRADISERFETLLLPALRLRKGPWAKEYRCRLEMRKGNQTSPP